ncbi:hypothetical protein CXZ10_19220 [Pleomorphomonas diazotrophica]|uniref:Aminoglycoside phosphotransferase domain-containing protein n=1 Tax=Pleomorphomonas diazotrophica TaxID=1166257 RepID=A0A1I4RMY5_9HYPH|nr:hypothetical protein CXZ10_19220 [Pleomorphomonas diazotrophica]SFM53293.1 hypothetical protein SAMN05192571_10296 [Pleomorphomonas diazotrophica]
MTASSRTAEIRRLAAGDESAATAALTALFADLFGLSAEGVAINRDQYSLNSLNGFFSAGGADYFFKFHQEDGEEAMTGEYYRADILARAGLPVDMPVFVSNLPGEQVLVYRRRSDPRFSDVLRALDIVALDGHRDLAGEADAVAAERALDASIARVYLDSLHPVTPTQAAAEPIHRLFHDRLVDMPGRRFPGGRLSGFYLGKTVRLPGVELGWDDFASRRLIINGRAYRRTVGELFAAAGARLRPDLLADAGGVVAHGDAHNANVWYGKGPELSFYDPAFAGEHVPALMAEAKATFHNVFAHPLWLYDPDEATRRFSASVRLAEGSLAIDTDWALTPVRRALLSAKAELVWKPLLVALKARDLLPTEWREVIRLALFLCPTLVMNLRAGAATHAETSSAIAFAVAVMVGSEPERDEDEMTAFFDAIDPVK